MLFSEESARWQVQQTQWSAPPYPTAFWARLRLHILVPQAIFYSSTVGFAICVQPKQAWSRRCHFPLSIKHAGAETGAGCLWRDSYLRMVMANAHYNWSEHRTINLDTFATKTHSPDSSFQGENNSVGQVKWAELWKGFKNWLKESNKCKRTLMGL